MSDKRSSAPARVSRALVAARRFARGVRRRATAPGPLTPVVHVTGATGDARELTRAALTGSTWFVPRSAPDLPASDGERAVGIGGGASAAVVAMAAQEPSQTSDAWALRRAAVVLRGDTPGDRDPAVWLATGDDAELRAEAAALACQSELRDRVAHRQRRDVIMRQELAPAMPPVSMLVSTNRPAQIPTVLANAARQTSVAAQLVLVTHGFTPDPATLRAFGKEHPAVDVVHTEAPAEWTLGHCLNHGIDRADGAHIVKMDDDNHYGAHFLVDLSHDLALSGAGLTGKRCHLVHLESSGGAVMRYLDSEHTWTHMVQGGTMYFDGDVARDVRFSDIPRAVDTDILRRLRDRGIGVYSSDRFNFVSVRRADPSEHTWQVSDATMLTATGRLLFYGDPIAHVEL